MNMGRKAIGVIAEPSLIRFLPLVCAADGAAVSRIANRGAAGGTFAAKTVGGVADIAPTLSADGINGLPSLAFDGTQSLHLGYTNKTEHFTLFAVYKWDAWEAAEDKGLWSGPFAFGAVQSAWAEDSNLPGAVAYYTKDGPRRIFGYANYANAAGGVVQTYIAADARSGATDDFATLLHEHEINGGETSMALGWDATDAEARDSTKSADVSSVAGFGRKIETMVLGARMMNSGAAYRNRMLNGKIGELLVFSRALTDAEKQSIRAYLKAKWFTASPASAPSAADTAETAVAIEVPGQATAFASGAFAGTAAVRKTGAGELAFGARAESAVAFDLDNWDTLLDACYADTAKVGFRVRGHARIVNSAVFNNYEVFRMDDPLAIDHVDGSLTVANCHFVKTSPHARLYRGASKYPLRWRDNTLVRFADKERRVVDEKLARDAQTSKEERR